MNIFRYASAIIVSMMSFSFPVTHGALIFSDSFDTDYSDYSSLSGNTQWRRTDSSNWFTSGGQLRSGSGISNGILYNDLATTLNSGGMDFTASVDVTLNIAASTGLAGITVNHTGTPTGSGYIFRFNGQGTVQLLRPDGSPIISEANAITPFDSSATYRLQISSASPDVFDLRIFYAATLKYEKLGVDNTASSSTAFDGVAGVFANAPGVNYDNFLLTSSVPEPGTLAIVSVGLLVLGIGRGTTNRKSRIRRR